MVNKLALEGQRIIVTGAGQGIGRAHALLLGERGAKVVVNDFSREAADAVVGQIRGKGGEAVASYDAVGSKASGQAIVEVAMVAFRGLDAIINNAGFIRPGLFENLSEADIQAMMDVHLMGTLYITQTAWPIMQKQKYGRVVMTSSGAGMFSQGGVLNYSTAKAGVFGLAKACAYEGQDHNILVNALLPMATTTISKGIVIPGNAADWTKYRSAEVAEQIQAKANTSPEMVAFMAAYLVSPECDVTGETYSVCRGRYGRVFVGVADGWLTKKGETVTPEMIRDRLPEIRDISHSTVPTWMFDEIMDVSRRLLAES